MKKGAPSRNLYFELDGYTTIITWHLLSNISRMYLSMYGLPILYPYDCVNVFLLKCMNTYIIVFVLMLV